MASPLHSNSKARALARESMRLDVEIDSLRARSRVMSNTALQNSSQVPPSPSRATQKLTDALSLADLSSSLPARPASASPMLSSQQCSASNMLARSVGMGMRLDALRARNDEFLRSIGWAPMQRASQVLCGDVIACFLQVLCNADIYGDGWLVLVEMFCVMHQVR